MISGDQDLKDVSLLQVSGSKSISNDSIDSASFLIDEIIFSMIDYANNDW